MNKPIISMLSLMLITSLSYAEVFTTQKQSIKYSLSTDKPLNFQFTLKSEKKENCEIEFSLVDSNSNMILFDKYSRKESQKTYNIPVNNGTYNLKMKNYSHNAYCLDKPFKLNLSKITGNYEMEINNNTANATPLTESKFYTGYLQSQKGQGQDTDFYKIDISKNGKIKLAFKHQDLDKKYSWNIELLNQNKKKVFHTKSALNTKGFEKYIDVKKGTYFIKIYSDKDAYSIKYIKDKEYNLAYILAN